jgi:rhodanese-related sulfurtransferase
MIMRTQKLKLIRFIVILVVFLLHIKESYAFFSPSSLQLLASSIGPWIQYLIVIIITTIVSFSIRIKKSKKNIIIGLILVLLIIFVVVGLKYIRLKNLNTISQPAFISELEGLPMLKIDEINDNQGIKFDDSFSEERYISFDSLNESEYHDYKKIVVFWYMANEYPLKDAIYIDADDLWEGINFEQEMVNIYLNEFNISKKNKLLFICYEGWTSQLISYFFYKKGYNSYYGSLNTIDNVEYIDSDNLKEINNARSIIVDYLDYDIDTKYYLFLFNIEENYYIYHFPSLINEGKIKKNIYGIKSGRFSVIEMKSLHPNINIVNIEDIDLMESKIICLSQLHCLLTKHKIDASNLDIKTIYFSGDVDDWERQWI